MASSSDDDVIVLAITEPPRSPPRSSVDGEEILISTSEILTWNLPSILTHPTVKILANRSRLIEHSSYFHGMLNWSFSESGLDRISIDWEREAFVNIVKFIYGCSIDVASGNFVELYEGALYFGVKTLLEHCKTWFSEAALSTMPPQIPLGDLICIWKFGFEHGNTFVQELCTSYLARNFMWAASCKYFVDVPYSLLVTTIKLDLLTIESEMQLCDAVFMWLDADTGEYEGTKDSYSDILNQLNPSLLPLRFIAGKRRSHFSKLAGESIASVFRVLDTPRECSICFLEDNDVNNFRIRLTEYSTKVDLSGCPQITSAMLLLSLLPSSYITASNLRNSIKPSLIKLESVGRDSFGFSRELLPMLSFEAIVEVNISKCRNLDLQAAIECLSMSFPSLKILKAANLLHFDIKTFRHLMLKCAMISEVDITLDISPVISVPDSKNFPINGDIIGPVNALSIWKPRQMTTNIMKLTLEGRSELDDSEILYIAKFCRYLQYLNVRGCTELTDIGLSTLFKRCVRLRSIIVCHTSFGLNSIAALCSIPHCKKSAQLSDSMAFNLQTLHISGCKSIDETCLLKLLSETKSLKSLCLSNTHLMDHALYSLTGSSLETLDVSDTMVSGAAMAHTVHKNPGLKCVRVNGCKNLCQQEINTTMIENLPLNSCGEWEMALGKTCQLEEFSFGWGFYHFSMEALKPAITSLKEITVGLGGSLGEKALIQLPILCPNLQSVVLHFQVISDDVIISITENLKSLRVLALCYCFGDISISGFQFRMPNLEKLQLERVTPWMTNKDLTVLTRSCPNLDNLSLLGCRKLDSDSQEIISQGWPGLVSIHLEDCGEVTANGVCSIFDCVALEDLRLQHNGPGIQSSFILDAISKLPLLRQVSLDLCDSSDGYFDIPPDDQICFLRSVKMARCKTREHHSALVFPGLLKKAVHKETLVLEWTGKSVVRKVVKERL